MKINGFKTGLFAFFIGFSKNQENFIDSDLIPCPRRKTGQSVQNCTESIVDGNIEGTENMHEHYWTPDTNGSKG